MWLALFFLALAVPSAILMQLAYSELKWQSFYQYRLQAEELVARIDAHLTELINIEEARPFADYAFLNVAGDTEANFVQRSPISAYPVVQVIPGLIGYFQVDARGEFSTPLLPQQVGSASDYGVSSGELQQRTRLAQRMQRILGENRLVQDQERDISGRQLSGLETRASADQREDRLAAGMSPAPKDRDAPKSRLSDHVARRSVNRPAEQQASAQAGFDQLQEESVAGRLKRDSVGELGRVEDLKLDYRYQTRDRLQELAAPVAPKKKSVRKERSLLPEAVLPVLQDEEMAAGAATPSNIRIRTFESEVDPFEISLLGSGQFVLFRKVWREGQRYIQGALVEQQPMLEELISSAFRDAALSGMSDLIVAYRGSVFQVFDGQGSRDYLSSGRELSGTVLHQARLSAPMSDLELIFNIRQLPVGPGANLVTWAGAVLIFVLLSLIHISEPTRLVHSSRMPSSA